MNLSAIEPFNMDSTNLRQEWLEWKTIFQMFLIASDNDGSSAAKKKALLLTYGGGELHRLFMTLPVLEDKTSDVYETAIAALDDNFAPQNNSLYERHKFRQIRQTDGQTVDGFIMALRSQLRFCGFNKELEESELLQQIIEGIRCNTMRAHILCLQQPKTCDVIAKLRNIEVANNDSRQICNKSDTPVARDMTLLVPRVPLKSHVPKENVRQSCPKCGRSHEYGKCPAYGQQCHNCGKNNHFANMCRARPTNVHEAKPSRESNKNPKREVTLMAGHSDEMDGFNYISVDLPTRSVKCLIDNASSSSLMNDQYFSSTFGPTICLSKKQRNIKGANNELLNVVGTFSTQIHFKNCGQEFNGRVKFVVVKDLPTNCLLGRDFLANFKKVTLTNPDADNDYELTLVTSDPESMLKSYEDLFDRPLKDSVLKCDPLSIVQCTNDAKPIKINNWRIPQQHSDFVKSTIKELVDNGVIRESQSEWRHQPVIVPKSDGSSRMTINYKPINSVTRTDAFPIPSIDDIIPQLGGMKIFSSLDFLQFYHQLPLHESDIPKTAFVAEGRLWEYVRLPFGLKNAVAYCTRLMNTLLGDIPNVHVYIDDVLICGRDMADHQRTLKLVLDRIRDSGLSLRRKKCKFFQIEATFLGMIVREGAVAPNPDRLEPLDRMQVPTNRKELQRYLGFTNYFRKYIEDYATKSKLLYDLMNAEEFTWNDEHAKVFEMLKEEVKNGVLKLPDMSKPFVVETDASGVAVAGVLLQDGKPVYFMSRLLKPQERHIAIAEIEALAVVEAFRKFRQYLLRRKFILKVDNKCLQCVLSHKQKSSKLIRWSLEIQEYDFEVQYKPTKENVAADALSRCLAIFTYIDAKQLVTEEQTKDIIFNKIRRVLSNGENIQGEIPNGIRKHLTKIEVYQDHVIINWHGKKLLVVPQAIQKSLMHMCHSVHRGRDAMLESLREYWWPGKQEDICNFIRNCEICCKIKPQWFSPPLTSLPVPHARNDLVCADFVGPLPSTRDGFRFRLTFIDALTRNVEVYPTKDMTVATVMRCFLDYTSRYGRVKSLLTDRGSQFEATELKTFLLNHGTEKLRTTAYHPQGNGVCERFHRTLKKKIELLLASQRKDAKMWNEVLVTALAEYRNTFHQATGFKPIELTYEMNRRKLYVVRNNIRKRNLRNQGQQKRVSKILPVEGDNVVVKNQNHQQKGSVPQHKTASVQRVISPQVILLDNNETVSTSRLAPAPHSATPNEAGDTHHADNDQQPHQTRPQWRSTRIRRQPMFYS